VFCSTLGRTRGANGRARLRTEMAARFGEGCVKFLDATEEGEGEGVRFKAAKEKR
jgi:hypothetical protein